MIKGKLIPAIPRCAIILSFSLYKAKYVPFVTRDMQILLSSCLCSLQPHRAWVFRVLKLPLVEVSMVGSGLIVTIYSEVWKPCDFSAVGGDR